MADVVGIVFHKGGRVYYFDPASVELARGDQVVVQTMRGTEIGEVVDSPREIGEGGLPAPLKRVVRRATENDLETRASNEALRMEAVRTCRRLIDEHGLDMKLVDAEIVFGGGKITYSFYSDERVDFRALVADLAKVLKVRIELRQIGAREEARVVGGLGPCGRHLCCTLWQGDQEPVSIRMAKEQHLPLNPMKISGLCGRLMCCLKYEQEQYVCFRKEAPSRGTQVQTEAGAGVVVGYQVPKDALTLRFEDGSYGDVPIDGCRCGDGPCRKGGSLAVIASAEAGHADSGRAEFGQAEVAQAGVAPVDRLEAPGAEGAAPSCPPMPLPRAPELVFEDAGPGPFEGGGVAAELSPAVTESAEGTSPDDAVSEGGRPPGAGRRGRSRGRRRRPRAGGGSGSQSA